MFEQITPENSKTDYSYVRFISMENTIIALTSNVLVGFDLKYFDVDLMTQLNAEIIRSN